MADTDEEDADDGDHAVVVVVVVVECRRFLLLRLALPQFVLRLPAPDVSETSSPPPLLASDESRGWWLWLQDDKLNKDARRSDRLNIAGKPRHRLCSGGG